MGVNNKVKPADIRFGSYAAYSGPYFAGRVHYNPQDDDLTFAQKTFLITSKAEGAMDAVNGYDSGIISISSLQFIDKGSFAVQDLLGKVVEVCGIEYFNDIMSESLKQSGAVFKRNATGKWRFFLDGGKTEVNNTILQHRMYHNGSNLKTSWTTERQAYSRVTAACLASLWYDVRAQEAQALFATTKLMSFVYGGGLVLFTNKTIPDTGWSGALRALYISFAINSPANAAKAVTKGINASKYPKWSAKWCLDLMHTITYYGIAIWPERYNKIRAELEHQFGIIMPTNAKILASRQWLQIDPLPARGEVNNITDGVQQPVIQSGSDDHDALAPFPPPPLLPEIDYTDVVEHNEIHSSIPPQPTMFGQATPSEESLQSIVKDGEPSGSLLVRFIAFLMNLIAMLTSAGRK